MNLDDLINDIENVQENVIAHKNAEEIAKKERLERVRETYRLMDDILEQLKTDFDAFDGVKFNPYKCENIPYEYQKYRVYKQYETFKVAKMKGQYGAWGFTADNGTICKGISFCARQDWSFKVQIEKHPDNDEIKFFFESRYYTFDEVKNLLDIPEGNYYPKKPLEDVRKKCFFSYDDFKAHLMKFMKSTIDIEDLKKVHDKNKVLKFQKNA